MACDRTLAFGMRVSTVQVDNALSIYERIEMFMSLRCREEHIKIGVLLLFRSLKQELRSF